MKIKIARQYIYLIIIAVFLFIFVLLFSFLFLVPEGKEYRKNRLELKSQYKELRKYQNFHDELDEKLQGLEKKHRNIIIAFDTVFNPERFQKQNKTFFSTLYVTPMKPIGMEEEFAIYEVNTTSQISSPKSFYNFLDAINKSDWIVGINFPINFTHDGELIKSSFTMKVYCNAKDKNSTKKMKQKEKQEKK